MERHKKLIAQQISNFSALLIVFILGFIRPATAQVDFPIGYVSRGGTYAFISLIEQHKLLEQEGIRPTFVYIGGPQVSQALISGDIRMAIVAAASPIRAAAHVPLAGLHSISSPVNDVSQASTHPPIARIAGTLSPRSLRLD